MIRIAITAAAFEAIAATAWSALRPARA